MKVLKCSDVGGSATCDAEFKASSSEEMINQAWPHLEQTHPEIADNIKSNPKEVTDKWMADFHAKFDSLPDAGE